MAETPEQVLGAALATLGAAPSQATFATLLAYADLLVRHGATHNLVGTLERDRVLIELVADSLVGQAKLGDARSVVDVGSGAGIPGLPLAIAKPETAFLLLEPRRKRVDFLNAARRSLKLANVEVLEGRVETLQAQVASGARGAFDAAVSRAVFAPDEWADHARGLLRPGGRILVWLSDANSAGFLAANTAADCVEYTLPGLEMRRLACLETGSGD